MYATAGFLFAAKGNVDFLLLIETLVGIALVIASACVYNNYLDRSIDAKMLRTKKRALVSGRISSRSALIYATVLGFSGFYILAVFTNWLVFITGAIAFIFYVLIYGYVKRRSKHGTLVGTIPGAAPPVAGYLAVTNQIDGATGILFLILVFWQMPHFYSISMYRFKDYKNAAIPVLSVKSGLADTKRQTLFYILAFIIATSALAIFGYAGYTYLTSAILLGFFWLFKGLEKQHAKNYELWGKKMFLTSLIVSLGISIAIAFGSLLP
jgi:protoheme IX farnesyltransferase